LLTEVARAAAARTHQRSGTIDALPKRTALKKTWYDQKGFLDTSSRALTLGQGQGKKIEREIALAQPAPHKEQVRATYHFSMGSMGNHAFPPNISIGTGLSVKDIRRLVDR